MRHRFSRALLAALLGLLVLGLSGCEMRQLQVIIPDFDSSVVEGVQVWRLDDATQQPVEVGALTFSEPYVLQGTEVVDYTQVYGDGSEGITLFAQLVRSPSNPDQVTLALSYDRLTAPGWFRVSSYNSVGSSALSADATFL